MSPGHGLVGDSKAVAPFVQLIADDRKRQSSSTVVATGILREEFFDDSFKAVSSKGDTAFSSIGTEDFPDNVEKEFGEFLESHVQHGSLGCFLRELAPREQRLLIRPASDNPAPPQGLPPCLVATTSTRS